MGYAEYFRPRLHDAFMKNKDLRDDGEVEKCLKVGEYVKRGILYAEGLELMVEIEMLYYLKRYRTLRKVYNETKS